MLQFDGEFLCCPRCSDTNVHLDDVFVGGRPREDGPVEAVHVDSGGHVTRNQQVDLPVQPQRRHVFSLAGWCEDCACHFAISFEQHKGNTIVSTEIRQWVSTDS